MKTTTIRVLGKELFSVTRNLKNSIHSILGYERIRKLYKEGCNLKIGGAIILKLLYTFETYQERYKRTNRLLEARWFRIRGTLPN